MTETAVRVLYVDDDMLDRELVRDALTHAEQPFEICEATSQEEFEAALARESFDIVLSDFNILEIDGLQVLERVQQLSPDLPVVIVTGTGSEIIAVEALKRGAADYIIKTPQTIARLPNAIAVVLQAKQSRDLQQQTVQALSESEQRLRRAVEEAPVPTMIHADDGEILSVSTSWQRISGYTKADMPTVAQWVDRALGNQSDAVLKRIAQLHRQSTPSHDGEIEITCSDGSTRTWDFSSTPLGPLPDGRRCAITIANDVTERLNLETRLRHAQKMEAVGRLAGGVAHDFNNMLQVIGGYATLSLQDQTLPDEVKSWLDMILEATARSSELTRQLLTFARLQPSEPQTINPGTALAGITGMLQRLVGEQIELRFQPASDTWLLSIDPSQLDSIVSNLVMNSRDAIEKEGRITVTAGNETVSVDLSRSYNVQPGEYVVIEVSDTGSGIAQPVLEHVFEPFFTTKPPGFGTGFGLSLVDGTVSQNGGFVMIDSGIGVGTAVRCYLPRSDGSERSEQPAESGPQESPGAVILLVEDDSAVLDITVRLLNRLGYQVVATTSPAHALELVSDGMGEIGLLITDVVMPEINGKQLADRVREILPGLPVLFTSGYPADTIQNYDILQQGNHFLPKPFNLDRLGHKIREIIYDE